MKQSADLFVAVQTNRALQLGRGHIVRSCGWKTGKRRKETGERGSLRLREMYKTKEGTTQMRWIFGVMRIGERARA